jgi:hypothetical protein
MERVRSKLTYANVVATLALFIAVSGGTAFAATQMLPRNSVGAKQLKKHAVTPAKLSRAAKIALTGPSGPRGAQGATGDAGANGERGGKGDPGQPGAAGSAKAWAEVSSTGVVLRSSPGLTVTRTFKGVYCIDPGNGFNNTNSVGVATIDNSDPATSDIYSMDISDSAEFNDCPAEGEFEVFGANSQTGASVDTGFTIAFV